MSQQCQDFAAFLPVNRLQRHQMSRELAQVDALNCLGWMGFRYAGPLMQTRPDPHGK